MIYPDNDHISRSLKDTLEGEKIEAVCFDWWNKMVCVLDGELQWTSEL